MYCMKCGQQLMAEARFCPNCGKEVPNAATPAAVSPPPPPPSPVQAPPASAPPIVPPTSSVAPLAPPPPPEPPITDHAHVGRNVLSLSWASGVQQLAEDIAGAPEVVAAMQTDLGTASSLSAKLETAVERVEPHYASDSAVAQTFDKLKRASEALVKGRQVQAAISATNPDTVLTEVELTEPEVALYDRCAEQVTFRNGLQMRLLRTCTSCRMQRIVNPEYEKMQRVDTTVGSLLSLPSNALMALYRWRRGMPKFVCPRCQGMNSVDRTVVLCPRCGTMLPEPLLSVCRKCGHDFAHPDAPPVAPPTTPEGQPAAAPPAPPPPPSASAPPPAAPRKVLSGKCAHCGNEFSVPLDRIPARGLKAKCKGCGAALTIRRPEEKNSAPE